MDCGSSYAKFRISIRMLIHVRSAAATLFQRLMHHLHVFQLLKHQIPHNTYITMPPILAPHYPQNYIILPIVTRIPSAVLSSPSASKKPLGKSKGRSEKKQSLSFYHLRKNREELDSAMEKEKKRKRGGTRDTGLSTEGKQGEAG